MYYAEKKINGTWCFRNTPEGKWKPMNQDQLHGKINELESKLKSMVSSSDVIEITERLDNMRVEIERIKEFTGLDQL